jgi:hypothetical protein
MALLNHRARGSHIALGIADMVSVIPYPCDIGDVIMTTKSKEVLVNPIDIMANGSLAQASKKPTALVPQGNAFVLQASCVSDTRDIVAKLSKAEKDNEAIEITISGQVDNLRDVMLVGSPDEVKQVVSFSQYTAVRALFMNEWIKVRNVKEDSAERAFNRYFKMTDLDVPLADTPDAIRKREAKAKREAEMQAIPDLGKAIADAVAVMDFDQAKKLKAEETRRKMAEVKEKNSAIENELKPIKDAIRDELKLCMDKAILVRVIDLLRKK